MTHRRSTFVRTQGNDYFAAGEHEKAIVSFTTASIIFPTEPTFPSNCAAARMKIAQYAEAVCDCTLALAEDAKNIKALYRRGTALAMLGHWKSAFVGASASSSLRTGLRDERPS